MKTLDEWAGWVCRVLGFRVRCRGSVAPEGVLLAPNHLGYADIPPLASMAPCYFLTRREFFQWPLIGRILHGMDMFGIERKTAKDLKQGVDGVAERLSAGKRVCVFLEGTSTGHDRILPFRTPLVRAAMKAGAAVVPVAIRWHATGRGLDVSDDLAYWKDHVFGWHVWRLCGLKGFEVEIEFGDPIPANGLSPKEIAAKARDFVVEKTGLPAKESLGWTSDGSAE